MTRSRLLLVLLLWTLPVTAMAATATPRARTARRADTLGTRVPPAPLLIPGRTNPTDSIPPERTAKGKYAMGRALERAGYPAAAISAYRKAVSIDPELPDAHYRMGLLYSAVHEHQAAVHQYVSELRHHPEHRMAERWLGIELAALGDTTRAIPRLRKLVQEDPRDEPSWQALGFALSIAGRQRESEQALRRALALDPRDGDAWRDLGVVLGALGDDAGAREADARAAKLLPQDPNVFVNLGNLERRLKNYDAALAAYREATARDSLAPLAWRGQVAVLKDAGRPEEAGNVYRAWLARNPDDPSLRMQAMQLFDSINRKDIALELARDGVRNAPRSADAHLALGMALHGGGAERAALAELRRAERLFGAKPSGAQVTALIRTMRARAPDSLRTVFTADSLTYEGPREVAADSATTTAPGPQEGHHRP